MSSFSKKLGLTIYSDKQRFATLNCGFREQKHCIVVWYLFCIPPIWIQYHTQHLLGSLPSIFSMTWSDPCAQSTLTTKSVPPPPPWKEKSDINISSIENSPLVTMVHDLEFIPSRVGAIEAVTSKLYILVCFSLSNIQHSLWKRKFLFSYM